MEYQMQGPYQYLVWYHAVGLIWISEFILAFQQMTISGAVVTYYFTRYERSHRKTFIIVFLLSLLSCLFAHSVFRLYNFNNVFLSF